MTVDGNADVPTLTVEAGHSDADLAHTFEIDSEVGGHRFEPTIELISSECCAIGDVRSGVVHQRVGDEDIDRDAERDERHRGQEQTEEKFATQRHEA